MSDFVRDLEAELIAAAHRQARKARHFRPPTLLTAALVAAALMLVALLPRASSDEADSAVPQAQSCSLFPDATLLLRDAPCSSNPFGQ